MKKLIESYSFNPTQKTVTFTELASIQLERILLVTNVTRNIILYNFADPSLGGTISQLNVLNLLTSTAGMSSSDKLQIFYDIDYPVGNHSNLSSLSFTPAYTQSAAISRVLSSVSPVILLPANNDRKTVIITNDSTANLYIAFSDTNDITGPTGFYSVFLTGRSSNGKNSYLTFTGADYSGVVKGVWSASNGLARITETY